MVHLDLAPTTATAMRQAMGRLCAGVSIVTALDGDGDPCGMTISSMTSISLEPPILMVSLTNGSRTTSAVETGGRFAVSILGSRQEAIALHFATRGGARFEEFEHDTSPDGLPVIPDALAHFTCTVHDAHDVGDHRVFYGLVTELASRNGTSLAFYSGQFGDFHGTGHDDIPWLF